MSVRPIALLILALHIFLEGQLCAQAPVRGFSSLSSAEKWWVIWHPLKAKPAFEISIEALSVTDSLEMEGSLTDRNGGDLDAFKHSYWIARLSAEIGARASLKLGRAHEKGNYRDFKKGRKEDGSLPDGPSSEMDLFNNARGAEIAEKYPGISADDLKVFLIREIRSGKMRVLRKSGKTFLDCQGRPLDASEIIGRWENEKCLIPSGG